jgi:hypothetical protein
MLRISHCLDSRLTDDSKFVSFTLRLRSTLQKHFSASGTNFCWRLSKPQGLVRPAGLGKWQSSFTFSGLEPSTLNQLVGSMKSTVRSVQQCSV